MRSRSFFPFAVAAIATTSSLPVSAQEIPFRAAVIAINDATVEYEVTNAATKTATAWSIQFRTVDSAGQAGQSGLTTDAYQTMEQSQLDPLQARQVFVPGESRRITSHVSRSPGAVAVTVEARVAAVIFEDGTSIGEPKIIGDLFASRQADRDTYAALLADLRAARANGGRLEDLQALAATIQTNRKRYRSPTTAEGVLQNLENAEAAIRRRVLDAHSALESLEHLMAIQHAAAAKHALRAP